MSKNMQALVKHFNAINAEIPLRPIRDAESYEAAVAAMNRLLDAGGADEGHPLADLVATLGELIGEYDDQHYPAPDVSGVAMLQFLMEQHGLNQSDLPEIGTQGVVSEIINGKREINIRQVRKLKARFKVSADAFA